MADLEDFGTAVGALVKSREVAAKAHADEEIAALDPRLLTQLDHQELPWAVIFSNGQRTDMEIGPDGRVTQRVIDSIAPRITATATLGHATPEVACFGDSLTDDYYLGAGAWPALLATRLGVSVYNGGWYMQRSEEIAARQGGLPSLVTVTGNSIPASGAVAVASIVNRPVTSNITTRSVAGTLAGVGGSLRSASDGTITFTRTAAGTATPCPPGTRFYADLGAQYRGRTQILWAGRNNVWDTDPARIVQHVRQMADYSVAGVPRVLVLQVPRAANDGATGYARTDAVNAALAAAFPAQWVPIIDWLRTNEAATAVGHTWTTQDQTDITNGLIPTSFRSDNIHPNALGSEAIAYRIQQEFQQRGWAI